ncbi:MAG: glycosyltransferase [Gammaproteobacteria bacterium]|nr:glycosyltransferase [Gammaproteobacteria bacterium]
MKNTHYNPQKKLLIADQRQFGSHIGTYHYCLYLNQSYEITVICWDYGLPRQKLSNIKVIYVPRDGNIISRNYRFIKAVSDYLNNNHTSLCFIKYFRGCSLLKFFHSKQVFIFDIRTGSISQNSINRFLYNSMLILESFFFRHITIISESLARKLNLSKKATILPLGSETISSLDKSFNSLDLLYVGTLSGRDIHKSVLGFCRFYQQFHTSIPMRYTIIGDGPGNEIESLKSIIEQHALTDIIQLKGRIPFTELKTYFDTHNIGVSFVPMTDYFDAQPVTKTFDYLLSGMPVIATATSENKLVIDNTNGVLINDSADDFFRGLRGIMNTRHLYHSRRIRQISSRYSWKTIVDQFGDYLEAITA